jgi:8-hydroxy-5-deazaflavin:NADPH oxidoreductase
VIAIPEKDIPTLPSDLFRLVARDLVVVDTGNYYPLWRDGSISEIDDGFPESVWVSRCINWPVTKAFNTIEPGHMMKSGKSRGADQRLALLLQATTC